MIVQEGSLAFEFPQSWRVFRPGQLDYYQKHFQTLGGGTREVDIVAFDPIAKTIWLIEVKDYSHHGRAKTIELTTEVAAKARDTAALILAGSARSQPVGEFWSLARRFRAIRVAMHCEVPERPSKLFPGVKDEANLQDKLRQAVRAIDPHAERHSLSQRGSAGWSVTKAT